MLTVSVTYVDGHTEQAPLERWRHLTGHGVDEVTIGWGDGLTLNLGGHSIYWAAWDTDRWRVGQWSGYSPPPGETLLWPDGRNQGVPAADRYLPDLEHADVKLGWWRPGQPRPGEEN